MARVPDGTTVETTLTMLAPLAARADTYWIGTSPNPAPDYVVFDADNSGWSPPPSNVLAFVEQRHPGFAYLRIFAQNDVYVFRRVGLLAGSPEQPGGNIPDRVIAATPGGSHGLRARRTHPRALRAA